MKERKKESRTHLANTRAQIEKLVIKGDRTGSVDLGREGLIVVQLVRVADGSVVNLELFLIRYLP